MTRSANVERTTRETRIEVACDLDAPAEAVVSTGIPFFDHMLDAFGRHGLMTLRVEAVGDLEVDAHHTVEDVGICLGSAVADALGDKAGIRRYGSAVVPMDEALVLAAIDVSGRGGLVYDVELPIEFIGTFETSLAREFMAAFAQNARMTVHVRKLAGENAHHIVEAAFKALARALADAVAIDGRVSGVPSTKGAL
ncbi:MAG TPA: imidazoleglycerol-phosphate dehydratase HisB [Coriobacteriia bacterium]|nr:imidazoleglycerol-phosphate dehydratase HisB [Coriobacteriia bacterium]